MRNSLKYCIYLVVCCVLFYLDYTNMATFRQYIMGGLILVSLMELFMYIPFPDFSSSNVDSVARKAEAQHSGYRIPINWFFLLILPFLLYFVFIQTLA